MGQFDAICMILVIAGVTFLLRATPFVLFSAGKETPAFVKYLGKVLPYAMMGMLVVYCFRNTKVLTKPYAVPEIIAGVLVVGLHRWKQNTLLSIAVGTVVYMVLVQTVF